MHFPHHLFPAIPHYHPGRTHRLLSGMHSEYAREVGERRRTVSKVLVLPTTLDVMAPATPVRRKEDACAGGAGAAEDAC